VGVALQTFEQEHFTALNNGIRMTVGALQLPQNFPRRDLGYGGQRARSDQYQINMPTAPIIHPYHLEGQGNERGFEQPAFTLNVKLPGYLLDLFPRAVHAYLNHNLAGMNLANVDVFLAVQDMPWLVPNAGARLSLKPQSWLDPTAPLNSAAPYNKGFTVQTGLFGGNLGQLIQGQPMNGLLREGRISTHNTVAQDGVTVTNRQIVSSNNVLHINNLDLNQTNVFYSLTKNVATGRAAIVKHILLNPQDEQVFEDVLNDPATINLMQLHNNIHGNGGFSRPSFGDEFDF
jgi:hypothetical protein